MTGESSQDGFRPMKRPRESESTDSLLRTVGNEQCRRTLYYLRGNDDAARIDGLIEYLSEHSGTDADALAIELHHRILPRLDELGAVDYDPDRERVLYRGGSGTTELIDRVRDWERNEY